MKFKNVESQKYWENQIEVNKDDPYSKACVDVAQRVMEILDKGEPFDTHKIICQADDDIKCGGITGFMAGCVAEMVSKTHLRGEEFRLKWNKDHGIKPDQDKGGVVNPALMTVSLPDE